MSKWLERLSVQDEALPTQTVVELLGDRRVLIEHHHGITEYSRQRIQARVKYGVLCVCGSGLELCKMSDNQLVILGSIDSLTVFRGN